jgi:hypothetical protein
MQMRKVGHPDPIATTPEMEGDTTDTLLTYIGHLILLARGQTASVRASPTNLKNIM